jgi:hypothetical protein
MPTSRPALPRIDRRRFVGTTLAGGAATALLAACSGASATPGASSSALGGPTTIGGGSGPELGANAGAVRLFADETLNFTSLLALGSSGVAAVAGEVIAAVDAANDPAASGGPGSIQAYYDAMIASANRLREQADDARGRGHLVTARARYLRAAEYFNQALFFVLGTTTPSAEEDVYLAMNQAFVAAAALMEPAWEPVEVPYGDSTLPAWFLKPLGAAGRRPTVILNNGSDGQNVDLWAFGGQAALERGWNALMFEGPGQGEMLFVRQEPFRPDWEAVISPLVDYLLTRQDVDPRRITLTGWSEGGELVARAAAFEHRLAAVVSDPGAVDVYLAFPEFLRQLATAGSPQQVNDEWAELIVPGATPEERFTLKKRLEIYSAGALRQARAGDVPTDWAGLSSTIERFNVRDVAGQIRTPLLGIDYEGEQFYPGQATELASLVPGSDLVRLGSPDGAQYHCAPMAPQRRNEVIFDWFEEVLA